MYYNPEKIVFFVVDVKGIMGPVANEGACGYIYLHESGQIIATSHDLTPNGGLVREIPLFQGNLGWWNIENLASYMNGWFLWLM